MLNQTPTQKLPAFIGNLKYEDIPPEVIEKMKQVLLVACGCYGSKTFWGQKINEFVQESDGPEESTLWFTNFRGKIIKSAKS